MGYKYICMDLEDEEHTMFIIDRDTYCYKLMPFDLKDIGANYQCMINKLFKD